MIPATASDGTTTYSVTFIGGEAFLRNGLTSVIIPDSVTTIGVGAFGANALVSVVIPDSVKTIGVGAFFDNALTSVTIPDTVETIGVGAFSSNDLASVIIPDGVEAIGVNAFESNALTSAAFEGNFGDFDSSMFKTNPSLTTITFCQGKTGWPQTFNIGNFDSPVDLTTESAVCAAPAAATPVPTSPLWLLGIMAGLLSLVGIRKLRKA